MVGEGLEQLVSGVGQVCRYELEKLMEDLLKDLRHLFAGGVTR